MRIQITILMLAMGGLTFANAQTLVDVNFDDATVGEPPPLLNSTPPTSLPSSSLVRMNFGHLLVVDEIGGMAKAVKFSPGGYCQPQVFSSSLSPIATAQLLFEFDFFLSNFYTRGPQYSSSVDEFTVLLDLPQIIRLNFQTTGSTGRISVGGGATVVGSFTFDTTHHLAIYLDGARQEWSALMDNSPLFTNTVIFADVNPDLGVRLNLTDDGTLASEPLAYVDNIRLTVVPEPRSLTLALGMGAVALFFRNRLKRSRS